MRKLLDLFTESDLGFGRSRTSHLREQPPAIRLRMVKITNIFGDQYRGQAGKAGVFAFWKGRQYRRKYVVPANPKTTMQMIVRDHFKNAVSMWHDVSSLGRQAFSYLATGLVMSGFNLLVKRYQKAATSGATLPLHPKQGIKQIGHTPVDEQDTGLTADNPFSLYAAPVVIGSLTYTPVGGNGDTIDMDAYVDLEMGDIRIPVALTMTGGRKATGESLAAGDQLLISYTSGGRTIDKEVLYTVEAAEIPAAATIDVALRTKYWPIDLESVVMYTRDITPAGEGDTQLESLEILNHAYTVAGEVVTPAPKIYWDMTMPTNAASHVDYQRYTAIAGAKLEVTKVDTSFITWRRYSGAVGQLPIAQTIEDETYDFRLSAPGRVSVIRAAQSAVLSTKHEFIAMAAA